MKMRVAFASQDGSKINDCCLKSSRWWIYEVGEDVRLLGQRSFQKDEKMSCLSCEEKLLKVLGDCELLFVQNVDANMDNCMLAHGKQMLTASQSVHDILKLIEEFQRKQMSTEYFKRIYQLSQIYGSIA